MPYYLNEVSGKIEKATKLQKEAYNEHMRAKSLASLLGSDFGAPTIATMLSAIFGPIIIMVLAKQGIKLADEAGFFDMLKSAFTKEANKFLIGIP